MHSLKTNFTRGYKRELEIAGRMNVWQRRFWDHVIRDEEDFERHLNYVHYNPVHHSYVDKPESWRHSSYMRWQNRGVYPEHWGWSLPASLATLTVDTME